MDAHAPLDEDLGWMLGVAFRAYARASEEALRELPGGPRGYQILTTACGPEPRNQGAIAEDLGIDRTVLTYLIDDLERQDLVVRRPDPADRRSRLIIATPAGRTAWESRREALRGVEDHLLRPLSAAESTDFRGLLRALACGAQQADPMTDLCQAVRAADPAG